ncbi:echinoderm microtubule-associated protein-like 2 [Porites lutea]|uniref:echinoderm microtubule-associated protein-like 2 n=1 Tax=Porites lutea TaxID=51062 RepID=UPI003CC5C191
MTSMPRFVTKIVGGKLVTVPEYRDFTSSRQSGYNLNATYPWGKYDSGLAGHKIGSRTYPVLPPISDGQSNKVTSDNLAQRIREALINVSEHKLKAVKHKFYLLDTDHSGRITTEELRQVLLSYQIFILGPTLKELVKKFEVESGGVLHEPLTKYLLDCHPSANAWQDKGKLSAVGLSNPVHTNTGQQTNNKTNDAQLLLEVENQLIQDGGNWDYNELKTSCQNCDRGRTGFIGNKEMKMLCKHHKLPLSRSLLERLLARFDIDGDGWVSWRELTRFLERALSVIALGSSLKSSDEGRVSNRNNGRTSAATLNKQISNQTISTETQTSTEPEPVKLSLRRRNIYVYPPDEYLDKDLSPYPPEEQLQLEWVYGYRGRDCRNNLLVLRSSEIIYFTAAVVVLYDVQGHKQRHYTEHTDDIKSLCVHPDGVTVASGQVKGHGDEAKPHIRVWDSDSLETICIIGVDYFEDAVFALAFSNKKSQGAYLASIEDNEYHTLTVWDWTRKTGKKKIAFARGHMDQVLAVSFSLFDSHQLVTCGKQHVTFWELEGNKLKQSRGRLRQKHIPKYVSCIAFARNGDVYTGDTDGSICVWPEESNQIAEDLGVRNAHSESVYTLLVLPNGVLLSGGGGESTVRAWRRAPQLVPTNVELKMPREVSGIRCLALGSGDRLFIGTVDNNIWCTFLNGNLDSPLKESGPKLVKVMEGHFQGLRGLATHPSSQTFITGGSDKTVQLWNAADRRAVWTNNKLGSAINAAAFHPDGRSIALGFKKGGWMLLNSSTGDVILVRKTEPPEKVSEIQFSPDGTHIALGCHDNDIYIYELQNEGKSVSLKARCKAHSSSVTHLDWSKDGEKLQSTSTDYELLFWDPYLGEQITQASSLRNTEWATHNCVLGYPVIGIWPDGADGTDVNSVSRSNGKQLLATGDDFGNVNLFRYPCVSDKAEPRVAKGHSAHVMCVRFLFDDTRLISVGGRDASILQWKVTKST